MGKKLFIFIEFFNNRIMSGSAVLKVIDKKSFTATIKVKNTNESTF
ncbi:hypothetical protein GCM10007422_17180 [Pedobacter zeae]|uniref:Uncharacterized protein n=1 Tax=Pedobacter zeae TaxID=1737356 RepID=A0A7W6P4A7_9SPHI|nr:hypothetical protein [Pedobacter zeae]GGH02591.1 hypothetical protein GCM10007422_17180 [Pedobacter zeae]